MNRLGPAALLLAALTLPALALAVPGDVRLPRQLAVAAQADGQWDLFLIDADTGEARNLTADKAVDSEPAWSPDGRRIAFVSDRAGVTNLFVTDPRAEKVTAITDVKWPCSQPRWSPDGKHLAFVANKAGIEQVFVVDADGKNLKQLTNHPTFRSSQPVWSPDGKRIAYTFYPGADQFEVFCMDADGGNAASVSKGNGADPAFSPDGKTLAFTSWRTARPGWRLFATDPEGKKQTELSDVDNPAGGVYPAWSANGKRIAFTAYGDGRQQIGVCDADGKNRTILTSEGVTHAPKWSPDGKRIACFSQRPGQPVAILVTDAEGKDAKELIRGVNPPHAFDWRPR
jgi:TolB protein